MSKKETMWREQLNEAVRRVRDEATDRSEFDQGVKSGASMVAVHFSEIQRRDEALKAEGIPRGSA